MGKVTAISRTAAAGALTLLAAAACGHSSPERIVPTHPASPSSPAGAKAACAGSGAGAGSVAVQDPSVFPGFPALDATAFVSGARGWAAGSGRILATADGGRTWRSQYHGPDRLYQLDFTDAAHGWAVGTSAVLSTSDGGATWTPLPEPCLSAPTNQPRPTSRLIDSVHFVTPRLGYAVAGAPSVRIDAGTPVAMGGKSVADGGGRLMRTTDGGRTWNPVSGAPSLAQSVCFTSPAKGFAGTPGRLWRTTDGGARWKAAFTEPPATGEDAGSGMPPGVKPPPDPDATALECAGASAAWTLFLGTGAAMMHAPYLAYATADGRNWHVLFEESFTGSGLHPKLRAPDGPGSYPGPFSVIGPGRAAYVGWNPAAGLGTAPLELVSLGPRGGPVLAGAGNVAGLTQPYAAAFLPSGQGWVVGDDQTSETQPPHPAIEYTPDSGRTWTRQAVPAS